MKKIFLAVLIGLSLNAYCQQEKNDASIFQRLFLKKMDLSNRINQTKENLKRELTPYINEKDPGFKQYLLTESTDKNEVTGSVYILSKTGIATDFDLFNIKLDQAPVIYFDKLNFKEGEDGKYKGKLLAKWKGKEVNIEEPLAKALETNLEEGEEVCIDHWWVTYFEETGEIIDVEYLGSDCYPAGSSGGGGSSTPPPPPTTCDQEANEISQIQEHQ